MATSAPESPLTPRKFRAAEVGKCHRQTAADRFGDEGKNAIRDRELAALGMHWEGIEPPFTWPPSHTVGEDDENGSASSIYRRVPSMQRFRNNLTTLSQHFNLYFVAYQGCIFVYVPRSVPKQTLPSHPELQLKPLPSEPAIQIGGYIDEIRPHTVNHLVAGNLGEEEIIVASYDDGDVVAYYTKDIAEYLSLSPKFPFVGATDSKHAGTAFDDPKPSYFFRENVGHSAWGLAVHKASRLIAVSSNRCEITVFALALAQKNRGKSHKASRLNHYESVEALVRQRTGNWRIVVALGAQADNLPNISFLDDDSGLAEKVCGIDIRGALWVADIWRSGQAARRIARSSDTLLRSEEHWPEMSRGWGLLPLRHEHFKIVDTVIELLGASPHGVVGPCMGSAQPLTNVHHCLENIPQNPCPRRTPDFNQHQSAPNELHAVAGALLDAAGYAEALGGLDDDEVEILQEMTQGHAAHSNGAPWLDNGLDGDLLDANLDSLDEMSAIFNFNDPAWNQVVNIETTHMPQQEGTGMSDVELSSSAGDDDSGVTLHDLDEDSSDAEQADLGNANIQSLIEETMAQLAQDQLVVNLQQMMEEFSDDEGAAESLYEHVYEDPVENATMLQMLHEYTQHGVTNSAHTSGALPTPALGWSQMPIVVPTNEQNSDSSAATTSNNPLSTPFSPGTAGRASNHDTQRDVKQDKWSQSLRSLSIQQDMVYFPHEGRMQVMPRELSTQIEFLKELRSFNNNDTMDDQAWAKVSKRYRLLRTFEKDMELRSFGEAKSKEMQEIGTFCPDAITCAYFSDRMLRPFFRGTGRLNMIAHVPELSLVVVGSPVGRVVILTPTRLAVQKNEHTAGVWHHGFRIDWILPRKSEEIEPLTARRPLHGLAIGPVQEARGKVKASATDQSAIPRRYRLMLHYQNHDVLTYEITREEQTEKVCVY